MDKTELSSDGFPPEYPVDFQPVPTSSPSSPGTAASSQSTTAYPVIQTQQVMVRYRDGDRMEEVPLVQSFVSHIILACFTFWCCGFVCGLIAFILAGR